MLSSSAVIEDNDWDSVRQATAALSRDLERIMLSIGQGGGDFGGAAPKSANDQQVAHDGNYGFNAVTTDMLEEAEARFNDALDSLANSVAPVGFYNSSVISTAGSGTFVVPTGVSRIGIFAIGGGGGGGTGTSYALTSDFVDNGGNGGGAGSGFFVSIDASAGESISYTVGAGGAIGASGGSSTVSLTGVFSFVGYGGRSSSSGLLGGGITNATPAFIYDNLNTQAKLLQRRYAYSVINGIAGNPGAYRVASTSALAAGGNGAPGVMVPGTYAYAGAGGLGRRSDGTSGTAGGDGCVAFFY